ncbi:MAG: DUF5069 domain-containing protein [Verrucomicrobiota bacterium]
MTDLTQRPPRSPRVRLGPFVLLPRILDKCRATIAGKNGEYNFNCPLDQRFFGFVQVDAQAFKNEVQQGRGDGEMLKWVLQNSKSKPSLSEIIVWSKSEARRVPADLENREFFQSLHKKTAPHREDIATWFDMLDVDDFVSFGGKA